MKKLMCSTAAKVFAYIILIISGILSLLSGFGIYIALWHNFYNMPYYVLDYEPGDILLDNLLITIYNFRQELIFAFILYLILAIGSFVFLLCSAGHKKNSDTICGNSLTRIPLDLLFTVCFFIAMFSVLVADFFSNDNAVVCFWLFVSFPVCLFILTLFLSDFTIRVKLGKWWQNTIIYRILHYTGILIKKIYTFNKEIFRSLPLIWKTAVIAISICIIEFIFFVICLYDPEYYIFFWIAEKIILLPALLYCALTLRKLQRSGEELAAGNLSYHTDTVKMFWDFKKHGENLNNIALGMSKAVEERLKSERLKTELITNVSHDIKTPLTSIINYSDLISKEPCENEKITEYSAALHRQSERLKKLINDLMDASKVSTGNIDVLLAPCEADIFLTQAVGEYEDKLKERELELVIKPPADSFQIMADGRHMWRIFDNLMNNVYKYAQSGTRVYLTLEKINEKAVFSLKNISHYALDISSDELMERFVRGDRSRNTEGSGLGLSIAKSLTELQNGNFELTIDGDFFKAVISFPIV